MRLISIIQLLILVLVFGCTNHKSSTPKKTWSIEFENVSKEFFLTEFADSVSVVPLSSEEILGSVSEYISIENYLVILDRDKTKKIFIFRQDGKLIASIASNGAGPGEFIWPRSIASNFEQDEIIIYCDRTKKVLRYSLEGKLISERGVSELGQIDDTHPLKNGYVLAIKPDSDQKDQLLFVDREFNLVKTIVLDSFYQNPPFIEGGKVNYFYKKKDGNGYYYKNLLSNYLVELDNSEVKNIFEFNLPDAFEVNINSTPRSVLEMMDRSKNEGKMYLGEDLVDMGDYLVLSIVNSGVASLAIWNKKNNKAFFVNKIINDISTLVNINGIWGSYNNEPGMLITSLEAPMFSELLKRVEIKNPMYAGKFSGFSMKSEDNPILIFYHFKSKFKLD